MCDTKVKERIYNEFSRGLEPNDVIVKLNIPHEKRVVYGCWKYYKSNVNTIHSKFLSSEMDYSNRIIGEQREAIENIAKFGRQLLKLRKLIGADNVHKKADDYTFARQVLLHAIESGKRPNDSLEKIEILSNIRRNYKDMENTEIKYSKIVQDLNNVVTIMENILPYFQVDCSNGTEIFIANRLKDNDEYRSNILSAIMEE